MAGYKTHNVFNLLLALPALIGLNHYYLHTPQPLLITFIGFFIYTTLFMSPDLDLAHKIRINSIRGLFSLPFRLYSRLFSHRGISHSFFLGSITRIIWLFGVAVLVFFIINQMLPTSSHIKKFFSVYKEYLLYGFAGICIADWSHLLLDMKVKR